MLSSPPFQPQEASLKEKENEYKFICLRLDSECIPSPHTINGEQCGSANSTNSSAVEN
jgi:hypothetical protein